MKKAAQIPAGLAAGSILPVLPDPRQRPGVRRRHRRHPHAHPGGHRRRGLVERTQRNQQQEPYRTGIARNHVPEDYQAIVDLGRALEFGRRPP